MNKLNILFVGALWHGGTALQRCESLVKLGHNVISIDYTYPNIIQKMYRFDRRVMSKLYRMGLHNFKAPDLGKVNEQVIDKINNNVFDIIFLDKCLTVDVNTMKYIKNKQKKCLIVGFSPDDMFAKHNQTKQFMETISLYDIYFTTKSYGVKELQALGCNNVEYIGNAFDPDTHKTTNITARDRIKYGGGVGFIGSWEQERANSLYYLARNKIQVRIWGEGWNKCKYKHDNLLVEGRPLWASEYAKGICSFDINLCFLRKVNRDLQTTRSIEIPACGAFMLAERTKEHQDLFQEGVEAEFFDSDDELLQKVRYYLQNEKRRLEVALAGQRRCVSSKYSYIDRMEEIITKVKKLGNE